MGSESRKGLVAGRGVVQFDEFCRRTGLGQATVENLMRTRLRGVSTWRDADLSTPVGIYDDALPARETLGAWGLSVRDDYDPLILRSHEDYDEDDGEPHEDAGPDWTMSW